MGTFHTLRLESKIMHTTKHSDISFVRRVLIAACLITGCVFAIRAASPRAEAVRQNIKSQTSAGVGPQATSKPELVTRNIEDIRLGQRVVGTNPLREQTQAPSQIDPESWRVVRLTMQKDTEYELAFLRPLSWFRANDVHVGGSIHLELPELGLNGPAEVLAIEPCPEIEPDDGTGRNVVTGTMAHQRIGILNLSITGLNEPLGVTDTHPFWSETRQDFVKAGMLQAGERFRTLTGESATLTKIEPRRGPPEMVFNLEVDGEHVYSVAGSGLLVHNNGCREVTIQPNKRVTISQEILSFDEAVDAAKQGADILADSRGTALRIAEEAAEGGEVLFHDGSRAYTGVMRGAHFHPINQLGEKLGHILF